MTTRPLLSPEWYRLRAIKPRLRSHVRIHRHVYRGRVWYVVEDRSGGGMHRFDPAAHRVIGLMDGQRDMNAIWALLVADLDDDTPTQDDLVRLIGQLHAADLVQFDVTPDVAELLQRDSARSRRRRVGRFANPIALRFALFDPDALLERLCRLLGPWLGWRGAAIWIAVVAPAALMVPSHWGELTGNAREQLLAGDNVWLLALVFPLLKAVHEIGHGLACRLRGLEVHEMGLMFLVFYPVPYVDVSSCSALADKWQRALVAAAGMLAELWVGAIALLLWVALEPGLARAVAYDVAVVATVTTVVFNANPLLRYDGYYILADLIECPNLALRALRHWQTVVETRVLGVHALAAVEATRGERIWFLAYAPLACVYRLVVSIGIAVFVAQKFFVVGVLIAIWAIAVGVCWPIVRALHGLATAPRFADQRPRIRAVLLLGTLAGATLLFWLPLPYHSDAEGVVWPPEAATLRAQASGFVGELLVAPGAALVPGQAVMRSVDPTLQARRQAQSAKVDETQARVDAAWGVAQAAPAQQLEQDLARERAALARLDDEADRLTLRSEASGTLLIDAPEDLPGRFVRKGDVVGYVQTGAAAVVRVALSQPDAALMHAGAREVEVRLAHSIGEVWPARVIRQVPAAAHQLPSAALGTRGGGAQSVDPRDDRGTTALESLFEVELELPVAAANRWLGSRVYVHFGHQAEPVGERLMRAIRRMFLTLFLL